jgi:hypothetical protein
MIRGVEVTVIERENNFCEHPRIQHYRIVL